MKLSEQEKSAYDKSSADKLEKLQSKLLILRKIFSSKNVTIDKGKIAKEILLVKAKIKSQKSKTL